MRIRAITIVLAAVTAIALVAVGGMRGAAPVGGTPYDHGIRQSALRMLRGRQADLPLRHVRRRAVLG